MSASGRISVTLIEKTGDPNGSVEPVTHVVSGRITVGRSLVSIDDPESNEILEVPFHAVNWIGFDRRGY